jgi:lipid-A-disaccharide synthase
MRYYIIAGELSGDLHASALIDSIKKLDANAEFRGWGGDNMQASGATIVKHINELAFMGFVEVVKNLRTILSNLSFCKKDIQAYKPDAVIFIDYPGFNLRIASWAKENNYKTIYYISPQIWAWKENRVHQIKQDIDLMMCILPFEKEFYKRHNHAVHFVGHPLIQRIAQYKQTHTPRLVNKKIIALLPGSRLQEIETKLPVMLSIVQKFPGYQFIVAQSSNLGEEHYKSMIKHFSNVSLVQNATYDILQNAHAALVTSGTATLETALFNVPQVVCYKGNRLSYLIAKQLIKVKYISLVNLIANKTVVTELIQDELNTQNLEIELTRILEDNHRYNLLQDYKDIEAALGAKNASVTAAQLVTQFVKGTT